MLLMTDRRVLARFLHDAWGRPKYVEEKARVQKKGMNKAGVLHFSCSPPEWSNTRNCPSALKKNVLLSGLSYLKCLEQINKILNVTDCYFPNWLFLSVKTEKNNCRTFIL